jgi:chromosome segregation protein
MRGGGMEDVIFAGTSKRPPRDFAEVVLGAVDADDEPLEVVRRIERGAGSAYRINGRDCRAKDVALVFADAATGAHSPALVSQGRIAAVIAAKPAERRAMLEEAAGIAGLHVRRRDAEQKLRATEANLTRLEDIMAGLDGQIAALRKQARASEKYRALSERIRVAEARTVFARWNEAAEAAKAAAEQAKAAQDRVEKARALAHLAQAQQAGAAKALAQAREELTDRRDDANAHGHYMAALTTKLEAAEQRLADLTRQHARLEADRGEADRLTHDAAQAIARLESEHEAARATLAQEEARRPTLAMTLEHADRAAREAEVAYAQATAQQAGIEAEWRVAEAEVSAAQTRVMRAQEQIARSEQAARAWTRRATPRPIWPPPMPHGHRRRRIWHRRAPHWTPPKPPSLPCKPPATPAPRRWPPPAPIWPEWSANTPPCCATARRGQGPRRGSRPTPRPRSCQRRAGL